MNELRRLVVLVGLALTAAGCDGDCLSRTELYRCTCTPANAGALVHCATNADQARSLAESTQACRAVSCQCTCKWEADDCDPNRNERCPR